MKTKLMILSLVVASLSSAHICRAERNDDWDPFSKKDKALLEMVIAEKGIHCAFNIVRGKMPYAPLWGETMDAKQYAEISLNITPSEKVADRYQAEYSETRWTASHTKRMGVDKVEQMGQVVKNNTTADPKETKFTLDSLKLREFGGRFYLTSKDGTEIAGPAFEVAPNTTSPAQFEYESTRFGEMYYTISPNIGDWELPFSLHSKTTRESGGIDLRSMKTSVGVTNMLLSMATGTLWIFATSFIHDITVGIQDGTCTAQ